MSGAAQVARYGRPAILERILEKRMAVIEASAGTGKTFTIEHLVIELLLRGHAIRELLVVTFTNKAATELRSRIREKLAELLAYEGEGKASPEGADWLLDGDAKATLARALAEFELCTIGTIHAFCQRLIGEGSFAGGRLLRQSQVDGERAANAAISRALRGELFSPAHPDERELLSAWLENRGESVERLGGLLFECLKEPARLHPEVDLERFARALSAFPLDRELLDQVETEQKRAKIHGNTRNALQRKLVCLFDALREANARESAMARCFVLAGLNRALFDELLEKLSITQCSTCALLREALEALASSLPTVEALLAHALLPAVKEELRAAKLREGEYDFQDMLTLALEALDAPGGEELRAALRDRYKVALIDEFQDTDPVQWQLFRRLFFESAEHRLYLVGDPKQAIYSFRGADLAVWNEAKREVLARTEGEVLALEQNFRSRAPLVEALNSLFVSQDGEEGEPARPFFCLPEEVAYDHPVTCGDRAISLLDGDGDEASSIALLSIETEEEGEGRLLATDARSLFAERMVALIHRLTDPARPYIFTDKHGRRPLGFSDIFVLAASAQKLDELGEALRAARLPFARYRQPGLFQTKEAKALIDLLGALALPADRAALARALLTPFFGAELPQLPALLAQSGADGGAIEQLWRWSAELARTPLWALLPRILDESALLERELWRGEGERAIANYQHLFELSADWARAGLTLHELLDTLRALRDKRQAPAQDGDLQRLETDERAIQLMTMHASKGLEAPVVIVLPSDGDNRKTLWRYHHGAERRTWVGEPPAKVKERHEAEEQCERERLLYVSYTRAKALLALPLYGPEVKVPKAYAHTNERLTEQFAKIGPQTTRMPGASPHFAQPPRFTLIDRPYAPARSNTGASPRGSAPHGRDASVRSSIDWETLKAERAGYRVTSFTRLSQGPLGALGPGSSAPEHDAHEDERPTEVLSPQAASEDALPAGAAIGTLLHELFAKLDLAKVSALPSLAAFREEPTCGALLSRAARRFGLSSHHLPRLAELLWAGLRSPLSLPGAAPLPGLAFAERPLREMEFHFPLPERGQVGPPFTIERGLVTGAIDLLFEHDGRIYLADWKSHRLSAGDAASIAALVEESYKLQSALYTLAALRMLGIAERAEYTKRFGGMLFIFLRPLAESGGARGIHVERPSFEELEKWNEFLTTVPLGSAVPAQGRRS